MASECEVENLVDFDLTLYFYDDGIFLYIITFSRTR